MTSTPKHAAPSSTLGQCRDAVLCAAVCRVLSSAWCLVPAVLARACVLRAPAPFFALHTTCTPLGMFLCKRVLRPRSSHAEMDGAAAF
eukprot:580992-Rhodomonas_salina.1